VERGRQEVPLQAEAGGAGELAWFVDGEYLGSAAAEERVWWRPSPGIHRLVVVDAAGRTAARSLRVREGLAPARSRRTPTSLPVPRGAASRGAP
jgi:membrane carboxypeptidase/penicillin-binding protein PbpC